MFSRPSDESARRRDPTRMSNQPALRTSHGAIWIIVGGIFAAICLVPLALLTVVAPRESAPAAWATAIAIIVLYLAIVGARLLIADREKRLRVMAVLMVAMAAVALIGLFVCAAIEWSAVPRVV